MILVVGGTGSGKRAFAHRLISAGVPGAQDRGVARGIGAAELDCAAFVEGDGGSSCGDGRARGFKASLGEPGMLLLNAHALAAGLLSRSDACSDDASEASWRFSPEDVAELAERLTLWPVVTWAEQGCGVVPVDARERCLREAAGRLGCELAARAETVVRMTCGVPQLLKGVLPGELPMGKGAASGRAPAASAPFSTPVASAANLGTVAQPASTPVAAAPALIRSEGNASCS